MSLVDVEKLFYFSFCATMFFSYLGDDEVAYRFIGRKPTGKEVVARLRFLIAKFCACLSGGIVMAVFFMQYIYAGIFSLPKPSPNRLALLYLLGVFAAFLLCGVLQNIIRRLQGRKPRSVYEKEVLKDNLKRLRSNPKDWL